MSVFDRLKKAVAGDEGAAVIKSGTLATTRAAGVAAVALVVAFITMDSFGFALWDELSSLVKWGVVVAIGAMWALMAAADSVARGLATAGDAVGKGLAVAAAAPSFVRLPAGLNVTRTEGTDSPGWIAVAVEVSRVAEKDELRFLVTKGSDAVWVKADDIAFA